MELSIPHVLPRAVLAWCYDSQAKVVVVYFILYNLCLSPCSAMCCVAMYDL